MIKIKKMTAVSIKIFDDSFDFLLVSYTTVSFLIIFEILLESKTDVSQKKIIFIVLSKKSKIMYIYVKNNVFPLYNVT